MFLPTRLSTATYWRVSEWLAASLEMKCLVRGCEFESRALRSDLKVAVVASDASDEASSRERVWGFYLAPRMRWTAQAGCIPKSRWRGKLIIDKCRRSRRRSRRHSLSTFDEPPYFLLPWPISKWRFLKLHSIASHARIVG